MGLKLEGVETKCPGKKLSRGKFGTETPVIEPIVYDRTINSDLSTKGFSPVRELLDIEERVDAALRFNGLWGTKLEIIESIEMFYS